MAGALASPSADFVAGAALGELRRRFRFRGRQASYRFFGRRSAFASFVAEVRERKRKREKREKKQEKEMEREKQRERETERKEKS